MPQDPLVSTEWLQTHLGAPDVRVVDASWHMPGSGRDAHAEYVQAHIPGAVFFDIDAIADRTSDLPHMLPAPEAFAQAVGKLGIGDGDTVVVYDSYGLMSAARVWWEFRAMGHEQVFVLDGGLPKWRAEGRPLEAGEVHSQPRQFTARLRPELVRDFNAVRQALGQTGEQVVDARAAARFTGDAPEPRAGLRSGHMPGSRNLPFNELIAPTGEVRPAGEISALVAKAGLDLGRPVTASCGSGITACVIALALARLGRWDTAVYDGSWAEWGARADAPVVTGPA